MRASAAWSEGRAPAVRRGLPRGEAELLLVAILDELVHQIAAAAYQEVAMPAPAQSVTAVLSSERGGPNALHDPPQPGTG
jgi:hypothetical protein